MNHSVQNGPIPIVRFLKEIYLTIFIIFFRFGSGWSRAANVAKGVAGVSLMQFFMIFGAASRIEVLVGARALLSIPTWVAVLIFLSLCGINRYVLVTCRHGISFEQEFNRLPKSKKVGLLVVSVITILAIFTFSMFAASAHRDLIMNQKRAG